MFQKLVFFMIVLIPSELLFRVLAVTYRKDILPIFKSNMVNSGVIMISIMIIMSSWHVVADEWWLQPGADGWRVNEAFRFLCGSPSSAFPWKWHNVIMLTQSGDDKRLKSYVCLISRSLSRLASDMPVRRTFFHECLCVHLVQRSINKLTKINKISMCYSMSFW